MNPRNRKLTPWLAALSGLLLLSGCAATAPPPEPAADPVPVTGTFTVLPGTETTEGGTSSAGSPTTAKFSTTNRDGYVIDVVASPEDGITTSDIANAPPGFTNVSVQTSSKIAITNANPGRDAVMPPVRWISVSAVWPGDSIVCAQSGVETIIGSGVEPGPCALDWGSSELTRSGLLDGATLEFAPTGNLVLEVAESDAPAVIEALSDPPNWTVQAGQFMTAADSINDCKGPGGTIVWATEALGDCLIPNIGEAEATPGVTVPSLEASAKVTELLSSATVEAAESVSSCPAGAQGEVTTGVGGIDPAAELPVAVWEVLDTFKFGCESESVTLAFDPSGSSAGSPQAMADQYAQYGNQPLVVTGEIPTVGGYTYGYCPQAEAGSACWAVWYDDNLAIRGLIPMYEGMSQIEKLERLTGWFEGNVPGIVERLAAS